MQPALAADNTAMTVAPSAAFRMKRLLKAERRIILASVLLVLLTGLLVSMAVTLPLYQAVRIQLEEVSRANARARQASIETLLDSYRNIARQFSSRTEIRKRLQAWRNGEIGLEQLRQYSQPRLQEPAAQTPGLAAMFRVSQDEIIVALGDRKSTRLNSSHVRISY